MKGFAGEGTQACPSQAHGNDHGGALAPALGEEQSTFEEKLDWDRALAKEIMPYTALGHLYDQQNGFGD